MTLQTLPKGQALAHETQFHFGQAVTWTSKPVDLRPALEEVRKMKEFQPPEKNFLEQWLRHPFFKAWGKHMSEAMERLTEALARFFQKTHLPGATHLPENIREFFNGFAIFLLVLVGLFVIYVLLGLFLRWSEEKYASVKGAPRYVEEMPLINAAHHKEQAKKYASQGRYTEGICQWYLALLCFLDESRLAPFSSTRSNREYSALLAAKLQNDFDCLAGQFESVRYGNEEGKATQFEQCESWYARFTKEAQPHA